MRTIPLALALASVAACGPEPEYLEANIDGALWQAEGASCFYRQQDGDLQVVGSRPVGGDTTRFLLLRKLPITGPATVALAGDDGPYGSIEEGVPFTDIMVRHYKTTDEFTGTVTVAEFDLGAGRCSGTFSFVALAENTGWGTFTPDTLHVTVGSWTTPELHVH